MGSGAAARHSATTTGRATNASASPTIVPIQRRVDELRRIHEQAEHEEHRDLPEPRERVVDAPPAPMRYGRRPDPSVTAATYTPRNPLPPISVGTEKPRSAVASVSTE